MFMGFYATEDSCGPALAQDSSPIDDDYGRLWKLLRLHRGFASIRLGPSPSSERPPSASAGRTGHRSSPERLLTVATAGKALNAPKSSPEAGRNGGRG